MTTQRELELLAVIEKMREALSNCLVDDPNKPFVTLATWRVKEALALPRDTSALDAYVAEKVKEIIESHAPEGRNVTNAQHIEMHHKFVEQIAALEAEVMRLRNALETFIAEHEECEDGDDGSACFSRSIK